MSRGPTNFRHSGETDARIVAGYASHEPVVSIAAALGVSKGVVIGRANRLGLASMVNKLIAATRQSRRDAIAAAKRDWWADPANAEQQAFIISRLRGGLSRSRSPNGVSL